MITMAITLSTFLLTSIIASSSSFFVEDANALSKDEIKKKVKERADKIVKDVKERFGLGGNDEPENIF